MDIISKLEGLEQQRFEKVTVLKDIDAQLAQTRRNHPDGQEMTRIEYSQWRNKAVVARRHAERDLMVINRELKQLRRARNERVVAAKGIDVKDPDTLIAHAYALLHKLACEGVELDAQEQAVIDGLRHYLAHVPPGGA